MSDGTSIEWADASWNPIRAQDGRVGWHCERVSPGCQHCYAETMNKRLGTRLPYVRSSRDIAELFLDEEVLTAPLRWRKPRKVFVGSMSDLFGEWVPDEWIAAVLGIAAATSQHTYQVLTKRQKRMRELLSWLTPEYIREATLSITGRMIKGGWSLPLPNVWLGVSCEDQERLDERVPELLATPAAVRWISAEPLLGPLNLRGLIQRRCVEPEHPFQFLGAANGACEARGHDVRGVAWLVIGGESGPGARPMHPSWARSIRDQCQGAGVAFFLKQWGEFLPVHDGYVKSDPSMEVTEKMARVGKKAAGRELDGRTWDEFQEVRT